MILAFAISITYIGVFALAEMFRAMYWNPVLDVRSGYILARRHQYLAICLPRLHSMRIYVTIVVVVCRLLKDSRDFIHVN